MTVSDCFNKNKYSSVNISSTVNCFWALFRHQVMT